MKIFYFNKLGLFIFNQWVGGGRDETGFDLSIVNVSLSGEFDVEIYLSFVLAGFGFGFSWSTI